tara:strand:- start:282 stop:488 length:207 start_codon:yes stop_codon:yes gene_type:complete
MDIWTTLGIKKHPIEKDEPIDDTWIDEKLSTKNLYKHRWVWYHLILCSQMIITNLLLVAILIILAVKL